MNVRHLKGVLHSFYIKNICYNKMDLKLFYFHVTSFPKEIVFVIDQNEFVKETVISRTDLRRCSVLITVSLTIH